MALIISFSFSFLYFFMTYIAVKTYWGLASSSFSSCWLLNKWFWVILSSNAYIRLGFHWSRCLKKWFESKWFIWDVISCVRRKKEVRQRWKKASNKGWLSSSWLPQEQLQFNPAGKLGILCRKQALIHPTRGELRHDAVHCLQWWSRTPGWCLNVAIRENPQSTGNQLRIHYSAQVHG